MYPKYLSKSKDVTKNTSVKVLNLETYSLNSDNNITSDINFLAIMEYSKYSNTCLHEYTLCLSY